MSVDSAHHLVAFMQAVAQAALLIEHENGQLLWSSLYMLHLHMLATFTHVLEVRPYCMGSCQARLMLLAALWCCSDDSM